MKFEIFLSRNFLIHSISQHEGKVPTEQNNLHSNKCKNNSFFYHFYFLKKLLNNFKPFD